MKSALERGAHLLCPGRRPRPTRRTHLFIANLVKVKTAIGVAFLRRPVWQQFVEVVVSFPFPLRLQGRRLTLPPDAQEAEHA